MEYTSVRCCQSLTKRASTMTDIGAFAAAEEDVDSATAHKATFKNQSV